MHIITWMLYNVYTYTVLPAACWLLLVLTLVGSSCEFIVWLQHDIISSVVPSMIDRVRMWVWVEGEGKGM